MTVIIRPDCHEAVITYLCIVWLCSLTHCCQKVTRR